MWPAIADATVRANPDSKPARCGGPIEVAVEDQRALDLLALDLEVELAALQQAVLAGARLVHLFLADDVLERCQLLRRSLDQRLERIRVIALVEVLQILERGEHAVGVRLVEPGVLDRFQERIATDLALDDAVVVVVRLVGDAPRTGDPLPHALGRLRRRARRGRRCGSRRRAGGRRWRRVLDVAQVDRQRDHRRDHRQAEQAAERGDKGRRERGAAGVDERSRRRPAAPRPHEIELQVHGPRAGGMAAANLVEAAGRLSGRLRLHARRRGARHQPRAHRVHGVTVGIHAGIDRRRSRRTGDFLC